MSINYEYKKLTDESLINHIKNNKKLQECFSSTFDGIKPKQFCGVVSCKNKAHYILPKISDDKDSNLKIFIYMLIYSHDIDIKHLDFSSIDSFSHDRFIEAFIQYFAKELLKELKGGVYKEYISKEENLKVLRGKILLQKHISTNFKNQNIYCEYDEFSEDNTLNQFFLYAIKLFLFYVKDKRVLKVCESALDEVSIIKFDIDSLSITFNKQNQRFKNSYKIALMILKRLIFDFRDGQRSFSFLFDMNELFEKFIGKIYKSLDKDTKLQTQNNFGNLQLKPDIIYKNKIIDTKYKLVKNKNDLKTSDKYQMFAYGTNYQKDTMLLYPKHLHDVYEELKLGKDEKEVKLQIKSVELSFSGKYEEFILEMKRRLEEIG